MADAPASAIVDAGSVDQETNRLRSPDGRRNVPRRRILADFSPIAPLRFLSSMSVRGLRGATSVTENTAEQIVAATRELLTELLRANAITNFEDVVSAIFTTTPDLTAAFPAEAARHLGMNQVPLLCASEIAVPHGMPRIIRILLHINTERGQREMVHVYLGDAKKLRPDVCSAQ